MHFLSGFVHCLHFCFSLLSLCEWGLYLWWSLFMLLCVFSIRVNLFSLFD